jgi:hypothetical protein
MSFGGHGAKMPLPTLQLYFAVANNLYLHAHADDEAVES